MLQETLVAERIVTSCNQEIDGDGNPTTRRLMEPILDEAEEHADDPGELLSA